MNDLEGAMVSAGLKNISAKHLGISFYFATHSTYVADIRFNYQTYPICESCIDQTYTPETIDLTILI